MRSPFLLPFRRLWLIFFTFVSHIFGMKNLLSTTVFLRCQQFCWSLSPSLSLHSTKKVNQILEQMCALPTTNPEKKEEAAQLVSWLIYCSSCGPMSSFLLLLIFFFDCPKTVDTVSLPKYFHRVFRWAHANTVHLWFIFPRFYLFLYVVYILCIPFDWIWLIKNSFASPPKCIETSMEYFV